MRTMAMMPTRRLQSRSPEGITATGHDLRQMHTRRETITGGTALLASMATRPSYGQSVSRTVQRVAGIFTVSVNQPWTSRVNAAAERSSNRRDIEYDLWQNVAVNEYEDVFREVSQQNYDLILGDCFAVEDLVRQLVLEFPENAYLMGSSRMPETQHERFCVFEHHIQDASYLTGLVAGALSRSGMLGLVGGYPLPDTNRLMNAFLAGATETNQDISYQIDFLDSRYAPALAIQLSSAHIAAGADVLYAERTGVAETARERNVMSIGTIIDLTGRFPGSMATSAIWHFDPTLWAALELLKNDEFVTGNMNRYSHLAHFGCELAPLRHFRQQLDPDHLEHIARREFEIRNGRFRVPGIDTTPVSRTRAAS